MIAIVLSTSIAFAQKMQEKDIPTAVKATFQKQYPKIHSVMWEKENGFYEANFQINKIENAVLLNEQGKITETEVAIDLSQLPKGVLDYVKIHYASQKVHGAAKLTDATGNVTFEAGINGMDVLFDTNGKFIKEMKD